MIIRLDFNNIYFVLYGMFNAYISLMMTGYAMLAGTMMRMSLRLLVCRNRGSEGKEHEHERDLSAL